MPDLITIVEYHFQDIHGTGADVECEVIGRAIQGPLPSVISEIREALKDQNFDETAMNIGYFQKASRNGWWSLLVIFGVLGLLAGIPLVVTFGGITESKAFWVWGAIITIATAILVWAPSKVRCSFRIRCDQKSAVERIYSVLQSNFPKVTILRAHPRFNVESAILADWALKCIERANVRAQGVAKALGVRILGVYSYEEDHTLPKNHYTPGQVSMPAMSRVRGNNRSYMSNFTNDYSEQSRAGASIRIQYRIENPAKLDD